MPESASRAWNGCSSRSEKLEMGLNLKVERLSVVGLQVGGFGPIPGQVHHFLMKTEEEQKEMAYSIDRYLTEVRPLDLS